MIILFYPLFWQNSMMIVEYNEFNTFEEESGQREKKINLHLLEMICLLLVQYSNSISQN